MDKILAEIISDLFINLAAGWIGAAIIVPMQALRQKWLRPRILTANLLFATLFLLLAYILKSNI